MPAKSLVAAVLCYLLFGLAFWQGAKTWHPLPYPASYSLTPVDSSQNTLLKTAYYTGVLLAPGLDTSPPDGFEPISLTPTQVMAAEAILRACIASGNTRGNEPRIHPGSLRPLADYYRQYQGYRTATGQMIIWINGFAQSTARKGRIHSDWKQQIVSVEDGGNNYFHLFVDLTRKDCFHFVRNSIGG